MRIKLSQSRMTHQHFMHTGTPFTMQVHCCTVMHVGPGRGGTIQTVGFGETAREAVDMAVRLYREGRARKP